MGARHGEGRARRSAALNRSEQALEPPPDLSGLLPDPPPRSHLLRRQGGSREGVAAEGSDGADGLGPPAAGGRFANRLRLEPGPKLLLIPPELVRQRFPLVLTAVVHRLPAAVRLSIRLVAPQQLPKPRIRAPDLLVRQVD